MMSSTPSVDSNAAALEQLEHASKAIRRVIGAHAGTTRAVTEALPGLLDALERLDDVMHELRVSTVEIER